jgi:hypothetical protein
VVVLWWGALKGEGEETKHNLGLDKRRTRAGRGGGRGGGGEGVEWLTWCDKK